MVVVSPLVLHPEICPTPISSSDQAPFCCTACFYLQGCRPPSSPSPPHQPQPPPAQPCPRTPQSCPPPHRPRAGKATAIFHILITTLTPAPEHPCRARSCLNAILLVPRRDTAIRSPAQADNSKLWRRARGPSAPSALHYVPNRPWPAVAPLDARSNFSGPLSWHFCGASWSYQTAEN